MIYDVSNNYHFSFFLHKSVYRQVSVSQTRNYMLNYDFYIRGSLHWDTRERRQQY